MIILTKKALIQYELRPFINFIRKDLLHHINVSVVIT